MRTFTWAALAISTAFLAPEGHAIILYGKDNSANQTDPGTGVPWENVGRVTNSGATLIDSTAVYLGDRFMLTANHVGNRTHVTFDGSTTYAVEEGSYQQVAPNVDLKVFRLAADPGLPGLMLYEDSLESADLARSSTLVAWGRGRDPAVSPNTDIVPWGDNTTVAKRWGTNTTLAAPATITYQDGAYQALQTRLQSSGGPNEAAVVTFDSGGALFQEIEGGWYLSGIASGVSRSGESRFERTIGGPPQTGDLNFFVRISVYSEDIQAIIPEPSTWGMILAAGALGLAGAGRRKTKKS